jgi:hypothetical protein
MMFEQKKPSETKKEMRFNNDEWIDMAMAWMLKTPDGKTESWQGHSIQVEPRSYAINNGVVAAVNERKKVFVAPLTSDRIEALIEAGYRQANFFVPLSNNEVPVADAKKWERMRKQADEKNKEEAEKQRGKK